MSDEIILNETELLLLQQQMEGDISGVGYSLQTAGVETADFRGREGENLYDSTAVQESDRTGWIRKIQFYIDDPSVESDRTVLLHIYRDGHVRCERYVLPAVANKIMSEIGVIREYSDFTTPLNELLSGFINTVFSGSPGAKQGQYIGELNDQFEDLIEEYFDTAKLNRKSRRLYISLIVNVGLALCQEGVPDVSEYPDVSTIDADSLSVESDENIEDFFLQYSKRVMGVEIEYSDLVDHLEHVLSQPWRELDEYEGTSPLNMIRYVVKKYNFDS